MGKEKINECKGCAIRSIIDLDGLDASYLHLNSVSLLHNAVMPTFHKENSVSPLSPSLQGEGSDYSKEGHRHALSYFFRMHFLNSFLLLTRL